MLGRFLEWSIDTPDVQASLDFYRKLGFAEAEVGEAWAHPYAVVTDGRISLGLHQTPADAYGQAPLLTFVKPDLLKHLEALERHGVEFDFRHLGNDVFNEVGWRDPSGHCIRLVEARTFSPLKRAPDPHTPFGYFLEIALPAARIENSKSYWEALGFVGMEEQDAWLPHVCCTSDTIDIGLYDLREIRLPSLLFDAEDVGASVMRLEGAGLAPTAKRPAAPGAAGAALFVAPEGTQVLLVPNAVA